MISKMQYYQAKHLSTILECQRKKNIILLKKTYKKADRKDCTAKHSVVIQDHVWLHCSQEKNIFDLSNTHIKAQSEEKAIQLSLLYILSSKFCFYKTFLNRQINSDGFSRFQIIKGLHCKMIIIIMMVIFCQSIPSNSVLRCQHCPCHRQDDHEHGSACAGCPAQARGCWD